MDSTEEQNYFNKIRPPSTQSGRSQTSHQSNSSTSSKSMAEKAIAEKIRVAELEAQANFHEKRISTESALQKLKIAEEILASRLQANIYEEAAIQTLQPTSALQNKNSVNTDCDNPAKVVRGDLQTQQPDKYPNNNNIRQGHTTQETFVEIQHYQCLSNPFNTLQQFNSTLQPVQAEEFEEEYNNFTLQQAPDFHQQDCLRNNPFQEMLP